MKVKLQGGVCVCVCRNRNELALYFHVYVEYLAQYLAFSRHLIYLNK